jgi:hypothetical protein
MGDCLGRLVRRMLEEVRLRGRLRNPRGVDGLEVGHLRRVLPLLEPGVQYAPGLVLVVLEEEWVGEVG